MLLPDVNVWLAMAFVTHTQHPHAKAWFDSAPENECAFCRMTQQGFLRLATNPKVFGPQAVSLTRAWQMYDDLQSDPRVVFVNEPAGLDSFWRGYTNNNTFSTHVWNDAYLAAFARAADFEIVTFDQGFTKFTGVKATIL